jgi:hypothetical protein
MMAFCLSLLLGTLNFEAQELPGVRVGGINPLNGQAHVNFVHADLDANGEPDLILPRYVLFQHDGKFATTATVAYPDLGGSPQLDVWERDVYLQTEERLVILRWVEAEWEVVLDQALNWPPPQDPETQLLPEYLQAPSAVRASRFLHDLDGDGTPEIIVTSIDGLHVYARKEEYALQTVWDILPPLELAGIPPQRLWPPQDRRLAIPLRQMACRLFIEDQRVSVLTRSEPEPRRCAYQVKEYHVETSEGFPIVLAGETSTAPLPQHLRPCRLNSDRVVDFAGGDWKISDATVLPRPVYETSATLDGGETLQARRQAGLRPHCSFIDFDGDGDLDMVTEEPDLFDGSLRESVTKFLSRAAVEHQFFLYQQISNRFSETPALRYRVRIDLGEPPFENGPMFQRYQANELINWTGDFNGDDYLDLAVQINAKELAVFLAAGFSLSKTPDALLPVPYTMPFAVTDVNGDGRDDIIVRGDASPDHPDQERVTVHFAQEK